MEQPPAEHLSTWPTMDEKDQERQLGTSNNSSSDHAAGDGAQHVAKAEHPSHVHEKMNLKLFMALTAMSFLWVGSQIPLYLFGSVLPLIYSDIGGADRYPWFVIGYLIPNAALCPFVGALSDMFGRRYVGIIGQLLLILGPIITATANTMNIAIAGQVFSGLGAGLNELIALVGTAEMVPVRKRGIYVGLVVFTILPFCPSALWAQLITRDSSWRYNGILVCVWNAIGLLLVLFFYKDPPRASAEMRKQIIREIDFVGGFLSTSGVLCFMMGLQWGAQQYSWHSPHVLVPLILGIVLIIVFLIYEIKVAKYPMVPRQLFHKAQRTMILILFITFLSGGNYFAMLLFWPTQAFNMYGDYPLKIGLRTLPIGFGIIGGAFISLFLIPITKGRITMIMIFFTALMTAATGAVSTATTTNLTSTLVVVTLASIGVGGVIIPSSIIAQIVCPAELIGTITAITLSIRYIGGAIGYTAYFNTFVHEYTKSAPQIVAIDTMIGESIITASEQEFYAIERLFVEVITLLGDAEFSKLRNLISTNPLVTMPNKQRAYDLIIAAGQKAFQLSYRWPYWISIVFGGICFIMAFFLGNIKEFLTDDMIAPPKGTKVRVESESGHIEEVAPQLLQLDNIQSVKAGRKEGH